MTLDQPNADGLPHSLVYAFGPFRISTRDRLLLRGSETLMLPPMVVNTLLVLLEAKGGVVTREELLEKVWGDTYVDPNSIAQNILRLRKTIDPELGAESIATLPKRGYRFVADVTIIDPNEAAPAAITPPAESLLPAATRVHAMGWISAAAGVLVVAMALFFAIRWHHARVASIHRPAVAILGFDDLGGEGDTSQNGWMGTALAETMYSELSADPNLRVVPNGEVEAMRSDLKLGRTTTLPPETLAQVREHLGCDMLVVGRYLVSDGKLRVDIALQDAHTAETVGTFHRTDSATNLLSLIAASGQALRLQFGMQKLSDAEQLNLAAAEPRNPEALHAYAEGMLRLRARDAAGARPFFERAVQLQPGYSLAHAGLSTAWAMLNFDDRAAAEAGKAFELAGNLSEQERLELEAQYAEDAKKWTEAVAADTRLRKEFPDDLRYGLKLAEALSSAGKPQDGLAILSELRKLPEPSGSDPRIALVEAGIREAKADFAGALAAAQVADKSSADLHEDDVRVRALAAEADALDRSGRHSEAHAKFAQAELLAASLGDQPEQVVLLERDAVALRAGGDLADAQSYAAKARVLSASLQQRPGQLP